MEKRLGIMVCRKLGHLKAVRQARFGAGGWGCVYCARRSVISIPSACCLKDWLSASQWQAPRLSWCLFSAQGCAALSSEGASWVSLYAGLHLGLQVETDIRYHFYLCECLTGVVFVGKPVISGSNYHFAGEKCEGFFTRWEDHRRTGWGFVMRFKMTDMWMSHIKSKSFQRNQWKNPTHTDLHNLVNKSDLIWCFQPLSAMGLMGDWTIIILPRLVKYGCQELVAICSAETYKKSVKKLK